MNPQTPSEEPRWRRVLNWGIVVSFFTMPLLFFGLQVAGIQSPWLQFESHIKEFGWTRDYFRLIAMLVFGLAGLNSWDRSHNNKAK